MTRPHRLWLAGLLLMSAIASSARAQQGLCATLSVGVDLLLRTNASGAPTAARNSTYVECFAANGIVNYDGQFTVQLKVNQVSPAVVYTMPGSGQGAANFALDAPSEYNRCYTASSTASAAYDKTGSGSAPEQCVGPAPVAGCYSCACSLQLCEQSEFCPLILDLNGDGIHTTGLSDPIHFWIDLQGRTEATAWTDPNSEEAFLWTDLNNDHTAQPIELFGSRMLTHGGSYHAHGFDALAKYDRPYYGGDNDGQITQKDWIWARLKLWVDRNHDGISQPTEISVLPSHGIVALNLPHVDGEVYDEHGNELYLVGSYVARTHGNATEERLMADIEFKFIPNQ